MSEKLLKDYVHDVIASVQEGVDMRRCKLEKIMTFELRIASQDGDVFIAYADTAPKITFSVKCPARYIPSKVADAEGV